MLTLNELRILWLLACAAALGGGCGGESGQQQADKFPVTTSDASIAPSGAMSSAPVMEAGIAPAPDSGATLSMAPGDGGGSGLPSAGDAGAATNLSDDAATNDAMPVATPSGGADACDRACLLAIMQGYIDALVAQDPSTLNVSTDLKYVENGAPAELGKTTWKAGVSLIPMARLDFADPVEGQVATQLAFKQSDSTEVLYQVRLKVVDKTITEIEAMALVNKDALSLVTEDGTFFFDAAHMVPEPVFLEPVDPSKRMSREELESVTQLYLDYLEGKKDASQVPFAADCKRYENGVVTASGNDFSAQSWSFQVTRRILVIDEEAGITWGMFPFSQDEQPLVVGEAFKIMDKEIKMIQAVMRTQPVWK